MPEDILLFQMKKGVVQHPFSFEWFCLGDPVFAFLGADAVDLESELGVIGADQEIILFSGSTGNRHA